MHNHMQMSQIAWLCIVVPCKRYTTWGYWNVSETYTHVVSTAAYHTVYGPYPGGVAPRVATAIYVATVMPTLYDNYTNNMTILMVQIIKISVIGFMVDF